MAAMRSESIPEENLYALKGFRRRCTTDVSRSGPALEGIIGICFWRGPGLQYYIQLREDDAAVMMDLAISTDDNIDSSADVAAIDNPPREPSPAPKAGTSSSGGINAYISENVGYGAQAVI